MKVKPLDVAKRNYENSASTAASHYKEAVARTSGWQAAAIGGQAKFVARMTDSTILARREKAIQNSSDEKWRSGAAGKGASRIGEGIRQGAADQSSGWAPYASALAAKELPPSTTDPMANIDNRLKATVQVLVDKKKEIKG